MKSRPLANQHSLRRTEIARIVFVGLLFGLFAAIYLPGIAGPWIYDDYSNLLQNDYVKIQVLDAQSLWEAAFSLRAGPLGRPVSMLSFALNYYAAGSFVSSASYKFVNLVLHIVNALLVFALLRLLLYRAGKLKIGIVMKHAPRLAAVGALLWLVHPIQLTSVLYVVQRMTELSALFTLAALVSYLHGRQLLTANNRRGWWFLVAGPTLFGLLGVLSKENAALLPFFFLCIEQTLFANEMPWRSLNHLPTRTRRLLLLVVATVSAGLIALVIVYALPRYSVRPFDLPERLMTEARVLFFYLSLIVVPRIDQFGHVHDDIEISRSLLDPWTTLPSLLGIALLIVIALGKRRSEPLLSLGILWFFAAHLMESTVIALEIAHEHRNYIALVGPAIVLLHVINWALNRTNGRIVWGILVLFLLVTSTVTLQRATQWADYNAFYRYEAEHHPASARTQAGLSILLEAQGRNQEAIQALRRAAEIESLDSGFMIQVHLFAARHGQVSDADDQRETLRRLRENRLTAITHLALDQAGDCLLTKCKILSHHMQEWLDALLRRGSEIDASFVHYLRGRTLLAQGRIAEATEAFRLSHTLDRAYLHPLFELAGIDLALGNIASAKQILDELYAANRETPFPRKREVFELAERIEQQIVSERTENSRGR